MDTAADVINDTLGELIKLSTGEIIMSSLMGVAAVIAVYVFFRRELKKSREGLDCQFEKVSDQFEKVSNQLEKVNERFGKVDQQFGKVDQQFGKVDQQFGKANAIHKKIQQLAEPVPMATEGGDHFTNLSGEHNVLNRNIKKIISKHAKDVMVMKRIQEEGIDAANLKHSIDLIIATNGALERRILLLEKDKEELAHNLQVANDLSEKLHMEKQALAQEKKDLLKENSLLSEQLGEQLDPTRKNDDWDLER